MKIHHRFRIELLAILAFIPFLHGCVGLGVVYGKEDECNSPVILEKAAISCNQPKAEVVTKQAVALKWGEPDSKYTQGVAEYWTYKVDTGYVGIVPMIGVGIPLILPLRANKVILTIENEKLSKATTVQTGWSGYMCGMLNENARWGCAKLK